SRDVRGSPTVEFTPTLAAPKPLQAPASPTRTKRRKAVSGRAELASVAWPVYGYDAQRLRWVPSRVAPPFRRVWTFRARTLVEFPPVLAYGRLFVVNNTGTAFAISAANGRVQWRFRTGRCSAASPAVADRVV